MEGQSRAHYRIIRRLGRGAMGEIYLADDMKLNRKVAIKTITGELADDPILLNRFKVEARAAASLNHPNVAIIVFSLAERRRYIHFEDCSNGFLDRKLTVKRTQ